MRTGSPGNPSQKKVFCKNEYGLVWSKVKNCFGKDDLERGHNLEPEPPARITGIIFRLVKELLFFNEFIIILISMMI